MKLFAALALSLLCLVGACAAPAHADVTCQFPVVVLAIAGPVTLVCGDGNIANTNQTNSIQVDPSLQVDPHLLAPAPH
jgi:hypothetical protein